MRIMTGVARTWLEGHIKMVAEGTAVAGGGRVRAVTSRQAAGGVLWTGRPQHERSHQEQPRSACGPQQERSQHERQQRIRSGRRWGDRRAADRTFDEKNFWLMYGTRLMRDLLV